jgi:hypothetical protein
MAGNGRIVTSFGLKLSPNQKAGTVGENWHNRPEEPKKGEARQAEDSSGRRGNSLTASSRRRIMSSDRAGGGSYPVGTRRFNSPNQFETTESCRRVEASSLFTMTNRWPSGDTSNAGSWL